MGAAAGEDYSLYDATATVTRFAGPTIRDENILHLAPSTIWFPVVIDAGSFPAYA